MWPIRKGVWLKLFFIYLLTAGCSFNPVFNIPTNFGGDKSESSVTPDKENGKTPIEAIKSERIIIKAKEFWKKYESRIIFFVVGFSFFILGFIVLWTWISSRLSIVAITALNKGEIKVRQFFRDTRELGQSFFKFNLGVTVLASFLFLFPALLLVWKLIQNPSPAGFKDPALWGSLLGIMFFYIFAGILFWLIYRFLPVLMVESQRGAWDALKVMVRWIQTHFLRGLSQILLYWVTAIAVSLAVFIGGLILGLIIAIPGILLFGIFVGFLISGMGGIVKALVGLVGVLLLVILVFFIYLAMMVPMGTFFTYLRMEMVKRQLT